MKKKTLKPKLTEAKAKVNVETVVRQKNADFTTSELMIKMNEILEEYPAQGNYAEDGRYTYPDRWSALLKYIKEKR